MRKSGPVPGTVGPEWILSVARKQISANGLAAVSVRAIAKELQCHPSTVQFHFGDTDTLQRSAVAHWAKGITESLEAAVAKLSGIHRTAELCKAWVAHPDLGRLPFEALRWEPRRPGGDGVRGALVRVLDAWVQSTKRSLQRAKQEGEIHEETLPGELAIELHRLVWSHSWTEILYGGPKSAELVLGAVWERLRSVAVSPETSLPPRDRFVGTGPAPDPGSEFPYGDDPRVTELWQSFLHPADPLYHACFRHHLRGDRPTLLAPPTVLPEDRAAAEGYVRRFGPMPEGYVNHGQRDEPTEPSPAR